MNVLYRHFSPYKLPPIIYRTLFVKHFRLPTVLSRLYKSLARMQRPDELPSLSVGKLLSNQCRNKLQINTFEEIEFKIFSQFGDDGIIQWLTQQLEITNRNFIEFGVENYRESNTRFLMMNNNWSGLVIDGSQKNIDEIISSEYFWKFDITARCEFIDRDNINEFVSDFSKNREIDLLSIDLDGNDYWVWQAINTISPSIVIAEYNSVFGIDRAITVPYDKYFRRTEKHHSNLYWGASLRALNELAIKKGYSFVGCNSAGNNAYFVRSDKLNNAVKSCTLEDGYVCSNFRESRNKSGQLTYVTGENRAEQIRGLDVYDVVKNMMGKF